MSNQPDHSAFAYESVQQPLHPEMRDAATIKAVIETAADCWPERRYMTDATSGVSKTYSEVNSRANEIAHALDSLGVESGEKVGLYLENSPEYVTGIYGSAKLGAIQTPINWQYREREVRHAIETAEVSTVLVQPEETYRSILENVVPQIEGCNDVVVLDEMHPGDEDRDIADTTEWAIQGTQTWLLSDLIAEATGSGNPGRSIDPSDPICILYTSGTTGLPKPAVHSSESYLLSAKSFLGAPLPTDDVNYNPFPLFHANNQCYGMLAKAIHGSEWVFSDAFSASNFFDHVTTHDVTSFNILGGVVQMLLSEYQGEDLPANDLDLAIGPIGTELWDPFERVFDVDVVQIYSQTENPVLLVNHPDPEKRQHGSIGKPMFPDLGHEVRLVDESGEEVPTGETGELWRTNVGTMIEYLGMPEKTEQTIGDGWLRSGDIARADEDGFYYYVDRKKFMVRRAGENISAQEVETVINEHPAVADCAIIPAPHDIYDEVVKALVRPGDESLEHEEVVLQVGKNLAAYKVPRYVEFVDSFPRTPSERIQRVALAEKEADREDHGWDREAQFSDWDESL